MAPLQSLSDTVPKVMNHIELLHRSPHGGRASLCFPSVVGGAQVSFEFVSSDGMPTERFTDPGERR